MLLKGFENKSHQRRAHYLKPRRNGRPIPTGRGSRSPPPHWLGLISYYFNFANFIEDLLLKIKLPTPHNPTENFRIVPFYHIKFHE